MFLEKVKTVSTGIGEDKERQIVEMAEKLLRVRAKGFSFKESLEVATILLKGKDEIFYTEVKNTLVTAAIAANPSAELLQELTFAKIQLNGMDSVPKANQKTTLEADTMPIHKKKYTKVAWVLIALLAILGGATFLRTHSFSDLGKHQDLAMMSKAEATSYFYGTWNRLDEIRQEIMGVFIDNSPERVLQWKTMIAKEQLLILEYENVFNSLKPAEMMVKNVTGSGINPVVVNGLAVEAPKFSKAIEVSQTVRLQIRSLKPIRSRDEAVNSSIVRINENLLMRADLIEEMGKKYQEIEIAFTDIVQRSRLIIKRLSEIEQEERRITGLKNQSNVREKLAELELSRNARAYSGHGISTSTYFSKKLSLELGIIDDQYNQQQYSKKLRQMRDSFNAIIDYELLPIDGEIDSLLQQAREKKGHFKNAVQNSDKELKRDMEVIETYLANTEKTK